jgi:hypothetical protein
MSGIERHVGIVRKVDLKGMKASEWCKTKCEELGLNIEGQDVDYEKRLLKNLMPTRFIKVNGDFWEIVKDYEDYIEEMFTLTPRGDGSFNFHLQFLYGYETTFEEWLENEINELY